MKTKIIILFLLLIICSQLFGQNKIVFVGRPEFIQTPGWLSQVATDWSATGICISLEWGMLDTDSIPGIDSWTALNNALISIMRYSAANLDIYIRINFGTGKPSWVSPTNSEVMTGGIQDFQIKSDNTIYDYVQDFLNPNGIPADPTVERERYQLNFASSNSRTKMQDFYSKILDYLNTFTVDGVSVKSRIKEVSPTFSHYQETEYPIHKMCGYSEPEILAFKDFLKTKYNSSISELNQEWESSFDNPSISDWSDLEVNPRNNNWDTKTDMTYPRGRIDWINFRTGFLANLLREFADLNSIKGGFKFGVQFGSIYDSAIENRGWIDPKILIEYADVVHVADIPEYRDNFNFGAEYLSSICEFWSTKTPSKPRTFTSESNGIAIFRNGTQTDYTDDSCPADDWIAQLNAYKQKGASAHFICDWDFSDTQLATYNNNTGTFNMWKTALALYKTGN